MNSYENVNNFRQWIGEYSQVSIENSLYFLVKRNVR